MPLCLGSYEPGENIGTGAGPAGATLSVPVPKVTSVTGPCAPGEVALVIEGESSGSGGSGILCEGTCTVALTHEFVTPPFNLDAAGGALIASAVLAVWAVGWVFRTLIRMLNSDGDSSTQESET